MGDLQDAANAPSVTQDEEGNTHYCVGCGARFKRARECEGRGEAPHPAIEAVPIGEILNAPDEDDRDAVRAWQDKHTPAPVASV